MVAGLYWVEPCPAGRLAVAARPRGDDWLEDDLRAFRHEGVDVLVSLLTRAEEEELGLVAESEVAAQAGLEFVSFSVPDYAVPGFEAARAALEPLAETLRGGRALAFHCRQAIGRSPLAAAARLTLLGVPPAEAWWRIELARGRPVPDTEAQRQWMFEFARLG